MLALGIDPGTRNLGWGLIRRAGQRLSHVEHGVIRVDGAEPLASRLLTIFRELDVLIETHRPDVASVEQIFFHKDPQAAAKLGHARGVVLLVLEKHGVPIREHAPARVKRTLTGTGRAEKLQVAEMVKTVLALPELPPADAADALAIALTELRLGAQAVALEGARKTSLRKKVPPHLARAISAARAKKGAT